jgi:hypothetical protein
MMNVQISGDADLFVREGQRPLRLSPGVRSRRPYASSISAKLSISSGGSGWTGRSRKASPNSTAAREFLASKSFRL